MELFNVYWTDNSGNTHNEMNNTPLDEIRGAVTRLTTGPGARVGVVKSVIVTDKQDRTCFHWKEGEIIFPREPGPQNGASSEETS